MVVSPLQRAAPKFGFEGFGRYYTPPCAAARYGSLVHVGVSHKMEVSNGESRNCTPWLERAAKKCCAAQYPVGGALAAIDITFITPKLL